MGPQARKSWSRIPSSRWYHSPWSDHAREWQCHGYGCHGYCCHVNRRWYQPPMTRPGLCCLLRYYCLLPHHRVFRSRCRNHGSPSKYSPELLHPRNQRTKDPSLGYRRLCCCPQWPSSSPGGDLGTTQKTKIQMWIFQCFRGIFPIEETKLEKDVPGGWEFEICCYFAVDKSIWKIRQIVSILSWLSGYLCFVQNWSYKHRWCLFVSTNHVYITRKVYSKLCTHASYETGSEVVYEKWIDILKTVRWPDCKSTGSLRVYDNNVYLQQRF